MNPIRFKESNIVMLAPPGMENCVDVHAHKSNGQVITCWKPTPEELVKINLGEPIWLGLVGETMQPAFVTVDYPFVEA